MRRNLTNLVICTSIPKYVRPSVEESIVQAMMARIVRRQLGNVNIKKHPWLPYGIMYKCPAHMANSIQKLIDLHFEGDEKAINKGWRVFDKKEKPTLLIDLTPLPQERRKSS